MEKKIRFATAILNFSKKKGGAERYLVYLCTRMVDAGYDAHVFAESWLEEDRRIHFHRVKTIPFPKSLRLLSFAIRATKEMERGDYDITLGVGNTLRTNVLQPHGGVHWAWFWRSLRAYDHPFLRTIKFLGRILSPKQWVNGYIEDAPYRSSPPPTIIAISDMVREDMIHWYGIAEGRIATIYNGVDTERFHPRNRQHRKEVRERHGIGGEFVVLFVSNNFRMKGLNFLMRALAEIKRNHPSFKLLILGRDRTVPYLRLVKKLDLLQETIFVGSTDQPERYYAASDLLVHPTFYDPCSLTVLEALASGLPVITTSSNGAGRIITQGKEGFVIQDPRDDKDLSEKISYFLNRERWENASGAARRLAEHHSHEKNWEEVRDVFELRVLRRNP